MLSQIIQQELYARGLSDYDKDYYKRKIVPRRRIIAGSLIGASGVLGASALALHMSNKDSKVNERFGHRKKIYAANAAWTGATGGLLALNRKVKDFHDYRTYLKSCESRGVVPLSKTEYIKEIRKIK